eukprot:403351020
MNEQVKFKEDGVTSGMLFLICFSMMVFLPFALYLLTVVLLRVMSNEKNKISWNETMRDAFCCKRKNKQNAIMIDTEHHLQARQEIIEIKVERQDNQNAAPQLQNAIEGLKQLQLKKPIIKQKLYQEDVNLIKQNVSIKEELISLSKLKDNPFLNNENISDVKIKVENKQKGNRIIQQDVKRNNRKNSHQIIKERQDSPKRLNDQQNLTANNNNQNPILKSQDNNKKLPKVDAEIFLQQPLGKMPPSKEQQKNNFNNSELPNNKNEIMKSSQSSSKSYKSSQPAEEVKISSTAHFDLTQNTPKRKQLEYKSFINGQISNNNSQSIKNLQNNSNQSQMQSNQEQNGPSAD